MDGSTGVQQTHRHAHRIPQPHEMPSGWPTPAVPLPPHCYGAPHPYTSYPAPFAGSFNHYPTPQVIYAPPPTWYYQNPPAQPSNSYVVYNGTTDNPHSGLKGQNSGGGGGKTQKGGEQKGHGDTGGADGDNAEGAKEDNAPSKKKGGGGGQKKLIPALLNCLSNPTLQSLHYDIRDVPETASLVNTASNSHFPLPPLICNSFITAPHSLKKIKLISKSFPWCIDIVENSGITLNILMRELHKALWTPTNDGEYWATTDEHRNHMFTFYSNNCAATRLAPNSHVGYGGVQEPSIRKFRPPGDPLRRLDWLLERTILKGLEKDDDFISLRLNDPKLHDDTWVVSLGSNSAY